jgi:hypothetical protein
MLRTNIHARRFRPKNKAMELPGNSLFELFLSSFWPYVVFVRVSGEWVRDNAMDDAMDALGMERKEGSCCRLLLGHKNIGVSSFHPTSISPRSQQYINSHRKPPKSAGSGKYGLEAREWPGVYRTKATAQGRLQGPSDDGPLEISSTRCHRVWYTRNRTAAECRTGTSSVAPVGTNRPYYLNAPHPPTRQRGRWRGSCSSLHWGRRYARVGLHAVDATPLHVTGCAFGALSADLGMAHRS